MMGDRTYKVIREPELDWDTTKKMFDVHWFPDEPPGHYLAGKACTIEGVFGFWRVDGGRIWRFGTTAARHNGGNLVSKSGIIRQVSQVLDDFMDLADEDDDVMRKRVETRILAERKKAHEMLASGTWRF